MSEDWRGQMPSPHMGAHTCAHTLNPSTPAWGERDPGWGWGGAYTDHMTAGRKPSQ